MGKPLQEAEQGSLSREDAIRAGVPTRIDRLALRRETVAGNTLRREEFASSDFIERSEPRVKVNGVREVLTLAFYHKRGDPEHVLTEVPRKYMDIDQAMRGNAHSKDGSADAKVRILNVADAIEESLQEFKVVEPFDEVAMVRLKKYLEEKLVEQGFLDAETGKARTRKDRRTTAVRQSVLDQIDIDTLLKGRALIARTVLAAGNANWLIELIGTVMAERKSETIFHFLSRHRESAIDDFEEEIRWINIIEQTLQRGRYGLIPAQLETFKQDSQTHLNQPFRPFFEPGILAQLFLWGDLNLSVLDTLFSQQTDEALQDRSLNDFINYFRKLKPADELGVTISASDENLTEFYKRLEAVKELLQGTIAFSAWNLGHSRKGKHNPNPRFGFKDETHV